MTPVIHCPIGSISIFHRTSFTRRRGAHKPCINISDRYTKLSSWTQRRLLAESSPQLFQIYKEGYRTRRELRFRIIAAVGTDVTVEEPNSTVSGENTGDSSESQPSSDNNNDITSATSTEFTARKKRPRPGRKSEMPPVKNEDLVPGATFTGKVRSIQPFGAFVDFGAFTDGLVHVSRMSDEYVKDAGTVVSIGQEVKVRIVEANVETGRISLTMRDSDDDNKPKRRSQAPADGKDDKPRLARKTNAKSSQKRDGPQKTTKLVVGQVLDGTVKNTIRAGAFVSLPEGEEGFLPVSEESEGFGNVFGNSSLQVGQEVNVRVLRVSRGQATLTMKKEEDVEKLNIQLNQGVVHAATNPFELAFRKNKEIAAFLEEREKPQKSLEISKETLEETGEIEDVSEPVNQEVQVEDEEVNGGEESLAASVSSEEASDGDNSSGTSVQDSLRAESANSSESSDLEEASVPGSAVEEEEEPAIASQDSIAIDKASKADDEVPSPENLNDSISLANKEEERASESEGSESSNVVKDEVSVAEENFPKEDSVSSENVAAVNGTSSSSDSAEATIQEGLKSEFAESFNGQTATPVQGSEAKTSISPSLVKQLREETGAGMMDCKKALAETGGDMLKAQEYLRKKGLASADKKASRATAEGRIGSYIHDNRIGVLIEVNCETDFVSRGEIFKELVDDLAMQVAACPQVRYLVSEEVPEEIVNKEREIEMQKDDLLNKPEQIRSKIVDGRIRKRIEEFALLEQPYIKNDKVIVKDWVKQTIATVGENIKVKRFVRYNLGEGLEKKTQDFAAEVAAQTAAKASPAPPKDQPPETKEPAETPQPTVVISAALVKQLREETGAGMMDCKKALAETGGDLVKAQEYLRKKGLSSADKKSSRLAAEGCISSYIHDSRIGCLIEVNCETDFVGRNENFKQLIDDLAMQVVACPQVDFVAIDDIPKSIVEKEKELEMQREDLQSKPENIREKIVEGRISKRLGELALLEQPFIKDDKITVKDLVKQTAAALGENIKVRRFVRFTLGENKDREEC